MTTTRATRHGKHHEDLVQIAGYITPELKAIAQVAANELKTNMMDLIRNGIISEATRAGVTKKGEVVKKYKPIVATYVDVYRSKKLSKKVT